MIIPETDRQFVGSVPEIYDQLLVPLIFAPYAADLAARVRDRKTSALLEVAAGTGVETRELAARMPATVSITATDLSRPMLDKAARIGVPQPVKWQHADAMRLPFLDASFDAVVCQFGVMFFPDRVKAYSEVRRVLRPGGMFLFNTWDRIEANEFAGAVQSGLTALYPDDPPRFLVRTPYGYFEQRLIREDLTRAGFGATASIDVVPARGHAASARSVAQAYCQGTPMRGELDARGPGQLARATRAAEAAVARRFGEGPSEGGLQALVVAVEV